MYFNIYWSNLNSIRINLDLVGDRSEPPLIHFATRTKKYHLSRLHQLGASRVSRLSPPKLSSLAIARESGLSAIWRNHSNQYSAGRQRRVSLNVNSKLPKTRGPGAGPNPCANQAALALADFYECGSALPSSSSSWSFIPVGMYVCIYE